MGVMSRTKTNRQPSMGDVAAAVGVSKTTISRYLHGNFGYMSDETKARIAQVIDELGYRPNRMAQGLKATVSHMIGVTIADIGNPFSSLLLKGIQQVCRERDVQLLVSDSNNQGALERANIESLLDAQVDGLIVNTVGGNDDWLSSYCLEETHKPVVLLDRIIRPTVCDGVQTANVQAVSEMMAHLESRGFDAVVFVTRPTEGVSTRTARREAVESFLGAGRFHGEISVYETVDGLREMMAALLARYRGDRVCLFANNEETMRDLLGTLPQPLPEGIGLCAFAEELWARYCGFGITCLDQRPIEMGRVAAETLMARVYDGSDAPYAVVDVPARLCIFDSTR